MIEFVLTSLLVLLCLAGVYIFIGLVFWLLTDKYLPGFAAVDRWIERETEKDG